MSQRKNVLFFLIDALRYDILADGEIRRRLTPNIDRLVTDGHLEKVVANAGTTQFVLPSLTAQRYPLDDGGYDTGVRTSQKTFAETFRDAGYATYLCTSLDQFCMAHDFERGFDEMRGLFSFSATLKRLIGRKLLPEIRLLRDGLQDEATTVATVQEELGRLLRKYIALAERPPQLGLLARRANLHNGWIAQRARSELELLESEPLTVLQKLETIPPFYYWTALGKRKTGLRRQWVRLVSAAVAYSRHLMKWLPYTFPQYTSFQFSAAEVARELPDRMRGFGKPWLCYLHVMDVHSYKLYRGLADLLANVPYLPRYRRLQRDGVGGRPMLHDLALMRVDALVGKLVDGLKQAGRLDNTIIVITGDHGQYLSGYGPRELQDIHMRTYREHLEVPLVLYGTESKPNRHDGLLDSMSVPATVLDAVGLDAHPSFKGVSAYDGGKPIVVAENAGRGSADLERKDLHFNVTGYGHSMKAVLQGSKLMTTALFDHARDPDELRDVKADFEKSEITAVLMDGLYNERAELFARRGASKPAGHAEHQPHAAEAVQDRI